MCLKNVVLFISYAWCIASRNEKTGIVVTMPKSSHFELLPSSSTKLLAAIDPSKCSRTIGSEGARSRVPAKFKCDRPSTPANFQSPVSTVGIHTVVDWITGYIKRPRSTPHIISLALVDSKPTKSTQEWRSRWVEDRKRKKIY